jgi:hypothetical protein
MKQTKAELYGKLQELKHENEQLKKQLILKEQSNGRTKR